MLAVGEKLGPYEIRPPLGEGGMGQVWKARDTRLGRKVALKISKREFTERFEREARAISALNHPHICQLYDVGPNYLVMEFAEGQLLKGPLPIDKALEYSRQILDALDHGMASTRVKAPLKCDCGCTYNVTPKRKAVTNFPCCGGLFSERGPRRSSLLHSPHEDAVLHGTAWS